MLISRTPYRFSFYGGGLDYPEWYKEKKSRVLCAGLDYYCYQTARRLPPFFSHKYRAAYSRVELAKDINEIEHPSIREVFRKYGEDQSLEVSYVGDLPARSGIGSSSAFTVGLINSLTALNGKFIGREKLANAAIEIEQKVINEKVGFQDQCAAAFGGFVIVEADKQSVRPRRYILRQEYIDYISQNLLLGFDGFERYSGKSSMKITQKISSGMHEELMRQLSQISEAGIDAFSQESDIHRHAELTKAARDIKLKLNEDDMNDRTQQLIEATERAGSICTRVMGAGGGGFFVCWAPSYRHSQIKESVHIKTWVDVRFSSTGSQVIFSE